jgi:hypothetical protein
VAGCLSAKGISVAFGNSWQRGEWVCDRRMIQAERASAGGRPPASIARLRRKPVRAGGLCPVSRGLPGPSDWLTQSWRLSGGPGASRVSWHRDAGSQAVQPTQCVGAGSRADTRARRRPSTARIDACAPMRSAQDACACCVRYRLHAVSGCPFHLKRSRTPGGKGPFLWALEYLPRRKPGACPERQRGGDGGLGLWAKIRVHSLSSKASRQVTQC